MLRTLLIVFWNEYNYSLRSSGTRGFCLHSSFVRKAKRYIFISGFDILDCIFLQDIFIRLCVILVTFSVFFQPIIAGPYRKLSPRPWDQSDRKRHITEQLLKSNNSDDSWFKQKKRTYEDPCGKVDIKKVFTRNLDNESMYRMIKSTLYCPSELTEVKCQKNPQPNYSNSRRKCDIFHTGECIDITTTIPVEIRDGVSHQVLTTIKVELTVGCACHDLI